MLVALALVALASGARIQEASAASKPPPNIVLAIADDLDPDHLGFCGNALAQTPNLDQLAQDGARFATLYAQPVCRPALATLLSGRWPQQTGIVHNLATKPLAPEGSLAARLAARGYASFCAGKFWEGDAHAYGFTAPDKVDESFGRGKEDTQDELFRFLEAEKARPWFVWWAPSLPHTPHRAPVRFQRKFDAVDVPVPEWFRGSHDEYVAAERAVLAMESWLDAEYGRLIRRLTELGELDDTLIVFLSDNGWATALPAKGTPFEKGVRSPLVIRPPGASRARSVSASADLVDVYATLLDYAGAPADERSPGRSLRPWLEGEAGPTRELLFDAAYLRSGEGAPNELVYALSARDARWKYVLAVRAFDPAQLTAGGPLAPMWRPRAGQEMVFDLEKDPLELRDLAGDPAQAERKRELRAKVLEWWSGSGGGELPLDGAR